MRLSFWLSLLLMITVSAKADEAWSSKMKELSRLLPALMTDTAKAKKMTDKEVKKVAENAKKFAELAHKLSKDNKKAKLGPIDSDPTIAFVADVFEDDARRAHHAISSGNVEYGMNILASSASYCIACHTRSSFGPQFPQLDIGTDTSALNEFEKANLYAAVRQFDRALAAYEKVIGDSGFQMQHPFDWETAVKRALAISIRVNQNPDKAIEITKKALTAPGATEVFKTESQEWIAALNSWKKEKKATKRAVADYFVQAEGLISQARRAQKYSIDASGDIYYLRASMVLHDSLRHVQTPADKAKAFYLLGSCYETLGEFGIWTLPETFYQACIESLPHSEQAEKCYRRYEKAMLIGYSGSGGYALPEDVTEKLKDLRNKSFRKK